MKRLDAIVLAFEFVSLLSEFVFPVDAFDRRRHRRHEYLRQLEVVLVERLP